MNDSKATKKVMWDLAQFERWVRVGVESYVLEDAGPAAFPEAAHLILRTGSLALGLRAFADGVNAYHRDNLKLAVAQVLSSLEPQVRYVLVAEQLLTIAVSISAYPVLNVLAAKIGNGFFGQSDPEGRDGLFALTLYTVARLSTPGRQDAKRCLQALVGSANFKSAHASTALIALCQVDSAGLVAHLALPGLRKKLIEQFIRYDKDGTVRMRVAHRIFAIIGFINLESALHDLDMLSPYASATKTSPDDSLIDALLFSPDSPLRLENKGVEVVISLRSNPGEFIVVKEQASKLHRPDFTRPAKLPVYEHAVADMSIIELEQEIKGYMSNVFKRTSHSGQNVTL